MKQNGIEYDLLTANYGVKIIYVLSIFGTQVYEVCRLLDNFKFLGLKIKNLIVICHHYLYIVLTFFIAVVSTRKLLKMQYKKDDVFLYFPLNQYLQIFTLMNNNINRFPHKQNPWKYK